MALLLDTEIVLAYYEKGHLVGKFLGPKARQRFYEAIVDSHFFVADVPRDAYARIAEIDRQYADLELGFVDCSIIAIAEFLGLSRIATTDRRDFDALQKPFGLTLLPR